MLNIANAEDLLNALLILKRKDPKFKSKTLAIKYNDIQFLQPNVELDIESDNKNNCLILILKD